MDDSAILTTPEMIKKITIMRPHNRALCMALDLAFFEYYNYSTWEESLSLAVTKWSNREMSLSVEKSGFEVKLKKILQEICENEKEILLIDDIATMVAYETSNCLMLHKEFSKDMYFVLSNNLGDKPGQGQSEMFIVNQNLRLLLAKQQEMERKRLAVAKFIKFFRNNLH